VLECTLESSFAMPLVADDSRKNVPQLAFGLYKVSKEECSKVVQNAIQVGYRHFDCAPSYENEKDFGDGLKAALQKQDIKRSDLCICSKVWKDSVRVGRKAVRRSIEKSIEDLCCDYLDIAMIHWPVPDYHIEAYKELEIMVQEGIIRSLGLSNYHEKVRHLTLATTDDPSNSIGI
jgi:2,5-diketo-D-gluconate reductase A